MSAVEPGAPPEACAGVCAKTRPGGSHGARHQRDGRRIRSRHFLRKQFGEADVAIGKRPHDYLPPVRLRLILESGQSHKLGELLERIVLLLTQQLGLFDTLADLIRHIPELRRE
jgi:hypothetical protein